MIFQQTRLKIQFSQSKNLVRRPAPHEAIWAKRRAAKNSPQSIQESSKVYFCSVWKRYFELKKSPSNKSFDSFLTQKKTKEEKKAETPLACRAQFFQNRIDDKATGKPQDYYIEMEKAMDNHKVYELAKVRKSFVHYQNFDLGTIRVLS